MVGAGLSRFDDCLEGTKRPMGEEGASRYSSRRRARQRLGLCIFLVAQDVEDVRTFMLKLSWSRESAA